MSPIKKFWFRILGIFGIERSVETIAKPLTKIQSEFEEFRVEQLARAEKDRVAVERMEQRIKHELEQAKAAEDAAKAFEKLFPRPIARTE